MEQTIQLENDAIVICSLLDGDTWESLNVFVGTCLGAIDHYQPASQHSDRIVRTFVGNNGMPFAIRLHRNLLFSVGDDRSLRVWSIRDGVQLFEKYGHGARPFAMELGAAQQLIFTAGMDDYCCVWRWIECTTDGGSAEISDLQLERRIDLCGGSIGTIRAICPYRCSTTDEETINLLFASERGALAAISFSTPSKNIEQMGWNFNAMVQQLGKAQAFAISASPVRLDGGKLLMFLDGKRHLRLFPIYVKQPLIESKYSDFINDKFLCEQNDDEQFRPDLFAYSQHLNILAVCTQREIFLFRVFQFAHLHAARWEGEFVQTIWIQPVQHCLLLTVEANGEMNLYNISSSDGICFDQHDESELCSSQWLTYRHYGKFFLQSNNNNNKGLPYIQCNLLIKRPNDVDVDDILLLGTRSGAILAYSLGVEDGQCLFVLREAHATYTVTALHLASFHEAEGALYGELHSLGRDGTLRKWKICIGNNKQKEAHITMCLISVCRLHFEWPCAFVGANSNPRKLFIGGFQSNDFVLMDAQTNSIVSRLHCGGGNRRWQLLISKRKTTQSNAEKLAEVGAEFCFAFTQKSILNCVPFTPMDVTLIRPASHSDNIVALADVVFSERNFLQCQNATINQQQQRFILSGSHDRRIVCSQLHDGTSSSGIPVLKPVCSQQMHRSSVETICVMPMTDGKAPANGIFVLSGGGRSEMVCYRMMAQTEGILHAATLDFLFSCQLSANGSANDDQDQDTRLLQICAINSRTVLVLCSDGTIRLIHLNFCMRSISEVACHRINSLAMFIKMELVVHHNADVHSEAARNVAAFAISTDGHLHTFCIDPDKTTGRIRKITQLHEPFAVERCGLSALASQTAHDNNCLLFVGSESGRLSVIKFHWTSAKMHMETTSVGWHASTVTGIQTSKIDCDCHHEYRIRVASVALDCRLCLGLFDESKNQFFTQRQIPLSISDPATLLLLAPTDDDGQEFGKKDQDARTGLPFACLISGAGLQLINDKIG